MSSACANSTRMCVSNTCICVSSAYWCVISVCEFDTYVCVKYVYLCVISVFVCHQRVQIRPNLCVCVRVCVLFIPPRFSLFPLLFPEASAHTLHSIPYTLHTWLHTSPLPLHPPTPLSFFFFILSLERPHSFARARACTHTHQDCAYEAGETSSPPR